MSGIALISKTDCETVMIRLIHNSVIVDRMEVDKVHYMDDKEIEANEKEIVKKLWEDMK